MYDVYIYCYGKDMIAMRKLLAILLVLCLCLGLLAACGAGSKKEEQNTEPFGTQPEGPDEETEGEPTEDEGPTEQLDLYSDDITLVIGKTMELYTGSVPVAEVTFGSENREVATFTNGIVTAVGQGKTQVYAEYDGVRMSCTVRCTLEDTVEPTTSQTDDPTEPSENIGSQEFVPPALPGQTVDASFFDDAVFVGDSISLKLSQYAGRTGTLGKAKFLVVGSYGVNNAVNDHPDTKLTYQGVKYTNVEEALAATGAKKVFIMLGMNDIALYGIDTTIAKWSELLDLIRSTCPNVTVYIQSMTPVLTGAEKPKLNNANVRIYNSRLKEFAASHDCKFIDIYPYMLDSTGGLVPAYCSDAYVHLTDEGAQRWIDVLKAYTGY